ncbi:MAG: beta-N-acetylhexosaminidase [Paenibacillus macerans]|uniref:beta-N-acetylhexosaminidase n=1 Tax=Paenibacillus macerans TaxID=44252 RepID=UPI00290EB22D|nr:beta-N-acetylhexosaminidase [Paenibacillus macerans]MDU7471976.1 beta-N-acetylhexosaminidase [Paenibacillus macerans]
MNLGALTLEQKVGQLFICGFHGTTPDEHIRTLIRQYHIGGVVYFRRNIESAAQLAGLSRCLQAINREASQVPLFISIDQEGGMVARLDHEGMSRIPGNMALGAANDPKLAEQVAALAAREMALLGINFNFAPCVDVNNNPANPVIGVRSFGEDPQLVARHATAAIRGYRSQGVIATAKHFPGHGDTDADSHLGLAVVPHGKERLREVELVPFRRAIAAEVDAIMTAHVIFPAFEPDEIPATLSRRVLTELLREELGYRGLIVTDCLEMQAISRHFGVAEGAVRAIAAGADLILVSHTMAEQIAAIRQVCAAVRSGRLSEERIDAAAARILALKAERLGLGGGPKPEKAPEPPHPLTPEAESAALLRRCAERSVTLVCEAGNLPLDPAKPVLVVWPELRHRTEVDEPAVHSYTLADALKPLHEQVVLTLIGSRPAAAEIAAVLRQSEGFEQIVAVTYTAEGEIDEGQKSLVNALIQARGSRLIVASSRNPYDIRAFPDVGTYLCLYENRPFALKALAGVLTGKLRANGVLPVSLNARYSAGNAGDK